MMFSGTFLCHGKYVVIDWLYRMQMIIVFYEHTTDKMLSVSYVVMIVISTIAVAVFGNGAVFALIVMKEWDKLPQELETIGYLKKESLNFDGLHIYMTLAMTNDGKSEELTY